jgi:hypothetical protein
MDLPTWAAVITLCLLTGLPIRLAAPEIEIQPITDERRMYWAGLYQKLLRPLEKDAKYLKFDSSSAYKRARVTFNTFVISLYKGNSKVENYLPSSARSAKGGSILNEEISLLAGNRSSDHLKGLGTTVHRLIRKTIESRAVYWQTVYGATCVAYSEVIKDLSIVKKITIKRKGKAPEQKSVNIHFQRPSKKMEVLEAEEKHFSHMDKPWDDMRKLSDKYAKSGVLLKDIDEVREAFRSIYEQQKHISDAMAGLCSARRSSIDNICKLTSKKKPVIINRKFIQDLLKDTEDELVSSKTMDNNVLKNLDAFFPSSSSKHREKKENLHLISTRIIFPGDNISSYMKMGSETHTFIERELIDYGFVRFAQLIMARGRDYIAARGGYGEERPDDQDLHFRDDNAFSPLRERN